MFTGKSLWSGKFFYNFRRHAVRVNFRMECASFYNKFIRTSFLCKKPWVKLYIYFFHRRCIFIQLSNCNSVVFAK